MPVELGRRQAAYVTLVLILLAGLLRFYRVDEALHIDSLRWFRRTQAFWQALAEGDLARTAQAPHPGVMLMWISGAVMNVQGTLESSLDPRGVFAIKVPGALVGTLSAALTFPLATACLGKASWRPALVLAGLLATEPLLFEQSRLGHLDMAALGFAWLGLWVAMLAYERDSWRVALGAGSLFAAAALTRASFAVIPACLLLILFGTTVLSRFRDQRGLRVAVFAGGAAIVTPFVLWPALWIAPRATLAEMLHDSAALAEAGHPRVVDGRRTADPGVEYYLEYLPQVTPAETVILACAGAAALYFVTRVRKHYAWLILSLLPYLVIIAFQPKKLSRYVLPMAPLLCLLVSASIEWLSPRVSAWWQRARLPPAALMSLLPLMFGGRYARDLRLLPEAEFCMSWSQVDCGRPANKNFMRAIALAIREDWQARGKRGPPRVFVSKSALMLPWLKVKPTNAPKAADYIVIWDESYEDAETGKLSRKAAKKFRAAGAELSTIRHSGKVVARVFRRK
jgi:hypothetical protein